MVAYSVMPSQKVEMLKLNNDTDDDSFEMHNDELQSFTSLLLSTKVAVITK